MPISLCAIRWSKLEPSNQMDPNEHIDVPTFLAKASGLGRVAQTAYEKIRENQMASGAGGSSAASKGRCPTLAISS